MSRYYQLDWVFSPHTLYNLPIDEMIYYCLQKSYELKYLGKNYHSDGSISLHMGVKVTDESDFQNFLNYAHEQLGEQNWIPLSAHKWQENHGILTAQSEYWIKSLELFKKNFSYSFDIHIKLQSEWLNHHIFYTDWVINVIDTKIHKIFDIAEIHEVILCFVNLQRTNGLKLLRFIIIAPSEELFIQFNNTLQKSISLRTWNKMTVDDVPNLLQVNPYKSMPVNIAIAWNEGLLEATGRNRELLSSKS